MTTEQMFEDLPSIFGSKGELLELSDEEASRLSEEAYQRYARVADANDACLVLDKKIHDTETECHAVVRELREAEAAVASIRKPTHTDLVREALCAATARKI